MIVVGVDGSECSMEAVALAASEAALRRSKLWVVCAWHVPVWLYAGVWAPPVDVITGFQEAAGEIADQALVEARRLQPELESEQRLVEGQAADVLAQESKRAELLVVGCRGLGGFESLLLGSTSDQVAHHASCPVLIVRAGEHGMSTHSHYGRIIVGVDGSASSRQALGFALHEAELRQASLEVICAWQAADEAIFDPSLASSQSAPNGERELEGTRIRRNWAHATLEHMLDEAQSKIGATGVDWRACQGEPISVLVDESHRADLLVVGSRGRGGFASRLLGSVSRECAHHARCPVVIVRQAEAER